ncbi:Oidioi.mRNA.OKI2018_I69.PAR.g9208.t1.cds [Oikopleura dioica]|uniref:Oidioi.mRNA.OKI2018_I69.PAR.g9208.t1.cds n=1 Tax=Oikopleura dioica TaxID=34765 RepID=A0ABN7RN28_OIKDI|nr:Oidioi.mRNA.OKI2018_I69.PAR.g9208.t1.cds [Oikopleura dioica]
MHARVFFFKLSNSYLQVEQETRLQYLKHWPALAREYLGYHSCELPTFYTDDGNEATWLNWAPNEPNNLDGLEYCVTMTEADLFNDYFCHFKIRFACRLPQKCKNED